MSAKKKGVAAGLHLMRDGAEPCEHEEGHLRWDPATNFDVTHYCLCMKDVHIYGISKER